MTPTAIDLLRALARILRVAAEEADTIAAVHQLPRAHGERCLAWAWVEAKRYNKLDLGKVRRVLEQVRES